MNSRLFTLDHLVAAIRGTGNMEHLFGITVLIRFDADGLHHLAPFLSFVRDKRAKVGSRLGALTPNQTLDS
jgi:hypothetical protein